MNNGYIAVIDSGIGGFSALTETARVLGGERFLYFGDNKNVPYGSKTKEELYAVLCKNLAYVTGYKVKAVIVGCNTLSVSVLRYVAPAVSVPVFGVYPPVEKKSGITYMFATPATCSYYEHARGIEIFPLASLAADIERHKTDLSAVDIKNHIKADNRVSPETLILGCTHYFFVKKQFIDHFCPRNVYSGERETADRVKRYLSENGLMSKSEKFSIDFIGENTEENFNFYDSVVKKMIFRE